MIAALITVFAALGLGGAAYFGEKEEPFKGLAPADRVESPCPPGWDHRLNEIDHAISNLCFSGNADKPRAGDWKVVLNSSLKFDYGLQIDTPGAEIVTNPAEVPGWFR